MLKRIGLIAVGRLGGRARDRRVSASRARPRRATAASASRSRARSGVQIGMLAPITGPAASIGDDQLHWAQYYVNTWNKTQQGQDQARPGRHAARAGDRVDGRAVSSRRTRAIMGVIGPAGSEEVQAVAPILQEGGARVRLRLGDPRLADERRAARATSSATSRTTACRARPTRTYMMTKLGVKKGDDGDDRRRPGVVLDRPRRHRQAGARRPRASRSTASRSARRPPTSRRSSPRSRSSTKVVFLPFQLASQAQLFAQQLKAQGKTAVVFGSDGTFDSSKFNGAATTSRSSLRT